MLLSFPTVSIQWTQHFPRRSVPVIRFHPLHVRTGHPLRHASSFFDVTFLNKRLCTFATSFTFWPLLSPQPPYLVSTQCHNPAAGTTYPVKHASLHCMYQIYTASNSSTERNYPLVLSSFPFSLLMSIHCPMVPSLSPSGHFSGWTVGGIWQKI